MTPALAVMKQLKQHGWSITYMGRMHALEGDVAISQEYRQVVEAGYQFEPIVAGRLQRKFTSHTLVSYTRIPLGFWQAFKIIKKLKPQIIMSFGGYVAVPIVVIAWLFGIPVVTHEQTFAPGLANKLIARLAQKICISWPETKIFFPAEKIVLTGNPVRKEVLQEIKTLKLPKDRPVIYITGGNLGAHSINVAIEQHLAQLAHVYTVIHQCGNAIEFKDFVRLVQAQKQLPAIDQKHYFPFEYIASDYIGSVFKQSDLIVSRSGANILTEIILLSKVSILIPLPWAGASEQTKNAEFLGQQNAALVLPQQELSAEVLTQKITEALTNHVRMENKLKEIRKSLPSNSAERIVMVIESIA